MKKTLCFLFGCVLAGWCHAGWLQTGGGSGITIQNFGDSPGVTSRLAAVEGQVADLAAQQLNASGRGLTWTTSDADRNWTGAALSADGRYQTAVVQNGLIYVSSDYGNAWTAKGAPAAWQAVAMSADGARQTACVCDGALYCSTNFGSTWAIAAASRSWVAVAMNANGAWETALDDQGSVYMSSDFGNTWVAKLTDEPRDWRGVGISTNGQYQTAVCERRENGDTGAKYGGGIYVSNDYGSTWALKQEGRDWEGVAVSGSGGRQVACAAGGRIYVSADCGNTWTPTGEDRDWRGVAASADGKLIFGIVADEGIHVSSDYGATWAEAGPARWWGQVATSGDGSYQIATIQGGPLWVARADSHVHGNLTADCALGIGNVGQFMIRGGTQLVFVAGGVVNVLDADILHP